MEASSEHPVAAENFPALLLAEQAQPTASEYVEDQEFPAGLPLTYDWMLQPASRRSPRRVVSFVAVTITVLLIIVSVYLFSRLPRPFSMVPFWRSSSS